MLISVVHWCRYQYWGLIPNTVTGYRYQYWSWYIPLYLISAFCPASPWTVVLCCVQASRQRWWLWSHLRSWSSEAPRPSVRWWCSTSPSSATGKQWHTVLTVPPRPPKWELWPHSSAPSHPSPSTGRCLLQVWAKCLFNQHWSDYCELHRTTPTRKQPCRLHRLFLFKILGTFFSSTLLKA